MSERQSPIDIKGSVFDATKVPSLDFKYGCVKDSNLVNTGHSWQINISDQEQKLELDGGKETYKLVQFHAHWGGAKQNGAEHCFDGKQHTAEIHFVHANLKYESLEQCLANGDGLAVFGVVLQESDEAESSFNSLIGELDKVKAAAGTKVTIDNFDLSKFKGKFSNRYYHYNGGLTTPPYSECVKWFVAADIVNVPTKLIDAMRELVGADCKPIANNFRECQNIAARKVFRNFEAF